MVNKKDYSQEEDLKIIELFNKGYTSREIAKILNRTRGGIQKRIQGLKKKNEIDEKKRLIKQIEMREVKKAINRENNNFLSNRATIKGSLSAYKKNDKGDLILDTKKANEQGFVYAMDMPGKSLNEEIREFNKFTENNKELNVIEYVRKEVERLREVQREVRKGIEKISV